jgi:hypothetical protein
MNDAEIDAGSRGVAAGKGACAEKTAYLWPKARTSCGLPTTTCRTSSCRRSLNADRTERPMSPFSGGARA